MSIHKLRNPGIAIPGLFLLGSGLHLSAENCVQITLAYAVRMNVDIHTGYVVLFVDLLEESLWLSPWGVIMRWCEFVSCVQMGGLFWLFLRVDKNIA